VGFPDHRRSTTFRWVVSISINFRIELWVDLSCRTLLPGLEGAEALAVAERICVGVATAWSNLADIDCVSFTVRVEL
jgi:hypothetical protein